MDPNDPIMIQRQQHEENLRRVQQQEQQRRLEQAENQHRLDHQQLIEDEEREQLLQQERAQALAAGGEAGDEAPAKKSRLWPFGNRKRRDDLGDELSEFEAGGADGLRDEPLEPTSAPAGGMGTMVWIVAVVLAGVLAWIFAPRLFKSGGTEAAAVTQVKRDPSLPLAAPGDPLSVSGGAGLPEAAGPSVSITDPLAVPPAAGAVQHAASSPEPTAAKDTVEELASTHAASDRVDVAVTAVAESPSEPLELRVSALEVRLANLQQELQRMQDGAGRPNAAASGEAVTRAEVVAPRPAPKRRRTAARPAARQTQQAVALRAAGPANAEQQLRSQMQAQLLAIDVWDGRPSVVVGTGVPGNKRVRVLQPGEQLHGVGLHSVDVSTGKATFSVGSGSLVTLDVKEATQP